MLEQHQQQTSKQPLANMIHTAGFCSREYSPGYTWGGSNICFLAWMGSQKPRWKMEVLFLMQTSPRSLCQQLGNCSPGCWCVCVNFFETDEPAFSASVSRQSLSIDPACLLCHSGGADTKLHLPGAWSCQSGESPANKTKKLII